MFIAVILTIARTWKQPRYPSTDEWIKKLWYICIILFIHKKEWIWVSCSEVDEPKTSYIEWSEPEREKQVSYINAYVWNLEDGTDEPIGRAAMETKI